MRFRPAGVALLFAVLLVLPARAAQGPSALEVLYPPDLTFTVEPKVKVFAFRGSNGEPVVPVVNGKAAAPLEGESFLKGEVSLSPGFNLLQVGGRNLRVFVLPDTITSSLQQPWTACPPTQ